MTPVDVARVSINNILLSMITVVAPRGSYKCFIPRYSYVYCCSVSYQGLCDNDSSNYFHCCYNCCVYTAQHVSLTQHRQCGALFFLDDAATNEYPRAPLETDGGHRLPKRKDVKISQSFFCNIFKKRTERPNFGGVSIRSRNVASFRKGCVSSGHMNKASNKLVPPPTPRPPPTVMHKQESRRKMSTSVLRAAL